MTLLQVTGQIVQSETSMNLFSIVMKGGWIMIPIFILLGIAVFFMSDAWVMMRGLMRVNQRWFAHVINLVYNKDIEQAIEVARRNESALGRITVKGLQNYNMPIKTIEEEMQVEARQILAKPEGATGYLSLIATIAPMLGFLGTIFGVIKIFFNISLTNDLSIPTISDGLYQKMICSGTGLLVGIIAYVGYYMLNRKVDTLLLSLDKGGSELIKAIMVSRGETGKF